MQDRTTWRSRSLAASLAQGRRPMGWTNVKSDTAPDSACASYGAQWATGRSARRAATVGDPA
eukprot:scaffold4216_cov389-Prasinococcus_capsulatus_cf.AAC.1